MKFNYEEKVWGGTVTQLSLKYLGYLRLKYCLQNLPPSSGMLLDIGCGGGGFAESIRLQRPDLKIVGLDLSNNAIKQARGKYKYIKFVSGDIYKLPFKKNTFDAVVVTDVFEHLENPNRAFSEIRRVLKPKGIMHSFIPLEGELYTIHYWFNKSGWKAKRKLAGHIQLFKLSDIKNYCQTYNFTVRDIKFSSHLFGQIVDVGFFTWLNLQDKKMATGLEEKITKNPGASVLVSATTAITNIESSLLTHVPGGGVHLTVVKSA